MEKNWRKAYIQIKKYLNKQVPANEVRSFYGAIVHRLQPEDKIIFITTSIFSHDSQDFCNNHSIKMLDYNALLQQLAYMKDKHNDALLDFINSLSPTTHKSVIYPQTCPKCYAPLVKRTKNRHQFYWCMNYHFTWCSYNEEYGRERKVGAVQYA